MIDPYQVLGISRSASQEEIKKAYRTLSRKYHPDANINNPNKAQAEEKFKEIQQAYKQIMDEREHGTYSDNVYGNSYTGGFGGFGGSYTNGYAGNQSDSYASEEYSMHLKAAANYINSRYYSEAVNVLDQMEDRTAQWYYLSAIANAGLGNNILALEHAKQASLMEPNNMQFMQLVNQLESGNNWYENMQNPYGTPNASGSGLCMKLCLAYAMCNLCLGGSNVCCNMGSSMGGYYPHY